MEERLHKFWEEVKTDADGNIKAYHGRGLDCKNNAESFLKG